MKRLISGLIALLPLAYAYADAPTEPPLEPHPMATIVFIVLFVGFCVVFAWMVWRKKEDKKEDQTPQS
jgi:membrane protein DedA with SNARE-associated domain